MSLYFRISLFRFSDGSRSSWLVWHDLVEFIFSSRRRYKTKIKRFHWQKNKPWTFGEVAACVRFVHSDGDGGWEDTHHQWWINVLHYLGGIWSSNVGRDARRGLPASYSLKSCEMWASGLPKHSILQSFKGSLSRIILPLNADSLRWRRMTPCPGRSGNISRQLIFLK